ncbi:MAG: 16S rRNA (cytosine(1402)-N(4))-methyltransferase RsmH [Nitrospirae bacterium]|nr:16S rRNA (cytosine(1402)-N(4))-methyltransferase RsmH [Nitrospirota bacterium]
MIKHTPVLLKEAVELLNCKKGGVYIDCTVGAGGHAERILELSSPDGVIIGIDQDEEILKIAEERLKRFGERTRLVHGNFSDIKDVMKNENVDGILFDLGVSSYQLEDKERGFSFMSDAPLDMRMDKKTKITAADIINRSSERELSEIIFKYGEERFAKRIASFIVRERERKPIATTLQLSDIIMKAIPARFHAQKIHLATRTFQALRIAVNRELEILEKSLLDAVDILKPEGRMCVISFHSLEDRIVKRTFQRLEKGCICPPKIPVCQCGIKPSIKIITKKPVAPAEMEIKANPRARSAKLRAAEKLLTV